MVSEREKHAGQGDKATPLHVHTLETLCKELISGRAVVVDNEGNEFRLVSPESRSFLNWYWKNRRKWIQPNKKVDVEAMVDKLDEAPPDFERTEMADEGQESRRVYLKGMRVHRFAGIHRYGTPENPPADFNFEFDEGLTLIEGQNGAGKTSLLNAICWCLTGYVYRAQRPPEEVDEGILLRIKEDEHIDSEESAVYNIAAITPAPCAEVLKALGDENSVPLDTSVELTFVDSEGKELGNMKRAVQRGRQGNIKVTEPDFSFLKLDPIAREVGTKMPGLIPYIQLGDVSELGQAVAGLTGLKPLEDLCKDAKKSQDKLKKDLVKDRNDEIESLDDQFSDIRKELEDMIGNHPEIKPEESLPEPGLEKTIEVTLETIEKHFASLEAELLSKAVSILGKSFDYEDEDAREDLRKNVGPAIGLVSLSELSKLDSAKRLGQLKSLDDEDVSKAEDLIEKLRGQARELADLGEKPDLAARLRLYARVANWIKDLPDEYRPVEYQVVESCPICQTDLRGKVDSVTGKDVKKHIEQCLASGSEHVQKTLHDWEEGAVQKLANELAPTLSSEMKKGLPDEPVDLISTALVEERFESVQFKKTLAPLKETAQLLCDKVLGSLPDFVEEFAEKIKLEFVSDGVGDLKKTFGPEDIFHYIYAVFHSPEYRRRYAEFLKIDFPRVPLPKSKQLFRKLCKVGEKLTKLHLMEAPILEDEKKRPRFPVEGNSVVEKGYPKYVAHADAPKKGKVYINKDQYFEGVRPEVWEFHIGGYKVCEKWLKDRRQRELSYEDKSHYQKIVVALGETIQLMKEKCLFEMFEDKRN